jgi:choline dehydrogenase-like flavoprotein
VSYLPLQNITNDYNDIIQSAAAVDPKSLFPTNIDPTIIAGYKAQSALILDLYASAQATVQEVAWQGGDTVPIAMLKPLSRGVITINTTDPTAPPVFDYGTFSHPADLDIAVAALKKTRQWLDSAPMQEVGAQETFPGRNVSSDAQIAASIRTFATSTWAHPTCSCSMMKRELGGVVDSELRVYGVQGLRIVDASVMPMIIGSHTVSAHLGFVFNDVAWLLTLHLWEQSSTVYAVAEKVS